MSQNQWLLVEWLDERDMFSSYGVVNANSLVNEDGDLRAGKIIFVRSKHGNSAKRAQIMRVSDNKRQLKEHKLLIERQEHQMKNMLTMCMRTIKEMKSDPLLYGSLNTSQQTANGAGGSGATIDIDRDSDSSSDDDLANETRDLQITKPVVKTPAQSKQITDYFGTRANDSPPRTSSQASIQRKRKSLASSTPLVQTNSNAKETKLTLDQATQTDNVMMQVPLEKITEMEDFLTHLYQQFLTLIGGLQLECEDTSHNWDQDRKGVVLSDKENGVDNQNAEATANQNNVEPQDLRCNQNSKSLQVRRVSAHTTNTLESSFTANREEQFDDMVALGAGHATVPRRVMIEINWKSYSSATRQLLQAVFPRKVLATHSLTGKRSPAFMNRPVKKCLDPKLVEDIVETVSTRCQVSRSTVRNCITIKCTDEAKLYRNRMKGRINRVSTNQNNQDNEENVPPSPVTTSRPSSNDAD